MKNITTKLTLALLSVFAFGNMQGAAKSKIMPCLLERLICSACATVILAGACGGFRDGSSTKATSAEIRRAYGHTKAFKEQLTDDGKALDKRRSRDRKISNAFGVLAGISAVATLYCLHKVQSLRYFSDCPCPN